MKPELTGYPAIQVTIKTGGEHFQLKGKPMPKTLLDFWRWSASDLVNNALRGQLAEYIVAQALDLTSTLRVEWDAYDLVTPGGTRIEIKSAAYLQSWYHKKLSTISFSIRPTLGWDPATNTYGSVEARQADIYVFCLLHHLEKHSIDPLNLDQWTFFILSSIRLNEACSNQKTITLQRLHKLGAKQVNFEELKTAINDYEQSCS